MLLNTSTTNTLTEYMFVVNVNYLFYFIICLTNIIVIYNTEYKYTHVQIYSNLFLLSMHCSTLYCSLYFCCNNKVVGDSRPTLFIVVCV